MYLYKAKDILNNKIVKGEVEQENEEMVKRFLADQYLYPISIKKKSIFNQDVGDVKFFEKKIKIADLTFFCKQLSSMIHAGISIGRSLDICMEQTSHKTLKKYLYQVQEDVNKGKTFSEAMADASVFPEILVSMIACGEAAGNLDYVLEEVVVYFERQLEVKRKLKKALTYPIIVVIAIIAVLIIMMIKVIPAFASMFQDTGVELPKPTLIVMGISNFLTQYFGVIAASVVGVSFLFCKWKRSIFGKRVLDRWMLKVPMFGNLKKKTISALFAQTMGMLVNAGLPMLQAMEILIKVMDHSVVQEELDEGIERLKHGNTLKEALEGSKIYPPILYTMIHIGEETGALDEMLKKIGDYFNDEVQTTTDSLMVLIEPLLTILIAFVVGGIMLAIMLPTFKLATEMM